MAQNRNYRSFDEIDDHLKILRLKREIDSESLRINLAMVKARLHPSRLIGQTGNLFLKIGMAMLTKSIGRLRKKHIASSAKNNLSI